MKTLIQEHKRNEHDDWRRKLKGFYNRQARAISKRKLNKAVREVKEKKND